MIYDGNRRRSFNVFLYSTETLHFGAFGVDAQIICPLGRYTLERNQLHFLGVSSHTNPSQPHSHQPGPVAWITPKSFADPFDRRTGLFRGERTISADSGMAGAASTRYGPARISEGN
jgi:hypothetical protein